MSGLRLLSQECLEYLNQNTILYQSSIRGKPVVIYQDKSYLKLRDGKKGQIYLNCRNRKCSGRGILKEETFIPTQPHIKGCVDNNKNDETSPLPKDKQFFNTTIETQTHALKQNDKNSKLSVFPFSNNVSTLYVDADQNQVANNNTSTIVYRMSNKGKPVSIYNKRSYLVASKGKSGQMYYKCRKAKCLGRAKIKENLFIITCPHSSHCSDLEVEIILKPKRRRAKSIDRSKMFAKAQTLSIVNLDRDLDVDGENINNLHPSLITKTPEDTRHEKIEYVKSQKGKRFLYYRGYLYMLNKARMASLYYICRRRGCKGKLCHEPPSIIKTYYEHNHPPDSNEYHRLVTLHMLREEILNNPTLKRKEAYDNVMRRRYNEVKDIENYPSGIPLFDRVKYTLGRQYAKASLKSKSTLDEVVQ